MARQCRVETPPSIGSVHSIASGVRSAFFDGLIDEVYVFSTALTASETADLASGIR